MEAGSSASVTSDAVVAFLDLPSLGQSFFEAGWLVASLTIEGLPPYHMDVLFAQKFEENHSYNLKVDFSYLYFAGSNIYWDGDNLTFDEWGEYEHARYQGVFFKWGSLVGSSPALTPQPEESHRLDPATTPFYVPTDGQHRASRFG